MGLSLLVLPFLPVARLFGDTLGSDVLVSPLEWLLGMSAVAAAAWLVSISPLARALDPESYSTPRTESASLIGGLLLVTGAAVLVMRLVFAGFPVMVDEVVQLFQAKVFASGQLVAPTPAEVGFFMTRHVVMDETGWYAQHPPGHSAVLALGTWVGAVWIVPILLTSGCALFLYLFARTTYGRHTARLTLALALLCPFFWILGASFMSHVTALFLTALGLYLLALWERSGSAGWLVGAAAALGITFLVRPYDAMAIGLSQAVWVVARSRRARSWAPLAVAALTLAAVGSLLLLYNALTTGIPFQPGYQRVWGEAHGLGFRVSPWGDVHTPFAGIRNELTDLALLSRVTFEWPIPALLPIGVLFALGLDDNPWDRRLLLGLLAIPAAMFFYWGRDAYLGPRFLYSTVAFALPLTARALALSWRRLRAGQVRLSLLPGRPAGATFLAALIGLSCLYAIGFGIPRRLGAYAALWPEMKVDVADESRRAGIREGLVFVAVSWGERLIARLRAAGLPAALVERAYRTVDHCELYMLWRGAGDAGWDTNRLAEEVEHRIATADPVAAQPDLTGDDSLRLRPGAPLTAGCRSEVTYDRAGFSVYTPMLLANRPTLDGPLVVARDLREDNAALVALHPGKPVFLYRAGRFEPVRPAR